MGAFTPYILFASNKFTPAATGGFTNTGLTLNAAQTTKVNAFQLGTKYDLSKRTFVYGGFGSSKSTVNTVNEVKSTGYGLGLVHNF